MSVVTLVKKKILTFFGQVQYKGVGRAIKDVAYEQFYKYKFKKKGVHFQDYDENLEMTNAKSLNKDSHENTTSSFYILNKAFKRLPVKKDDISLLDIGCGAGRVLSFGMFLGFRKVVGIDLDEPALKSAVINCSKMQEKECATNFAVEHADANNFPIPPDINVVYLYNPFGLKTLQAVMGNILNQVKGGGKDIFLIYANPSYRGVLDEYDSCQRIYQSHYRKQTHADLVIYRISNSLKKQA